MPLPKLPSKPAALLLAADYPKADPRNKPAVQAVPPPKPKLAAVSEAPAAAPAKAPAKTVKAKVAAPVEAPAPVAKPSARGKEKQHAEAPHPAKHKAVELQVKSK